MRINKYIAHSGFCSRRKADTLVESGSVKISGKVAVSGDSVEPGQRVEIKHQGKWIHVKLPQSHRTFAIYKPVGVLSSLDPDSPNSLYDLLVEQRLISPDKPASLSPAGRLDVASRGLLVVSSDGDLIQKLTHPSFEHWKWYAVRFSGPIEEAQVEAFKNGVKLDDGMTAPARVEKISARRIILGLREGRNRQIRRMAEALHLQVEDLLRYGVGSLWLPKIAPGQSKELGEEDLGRLMAKGPKILKMPDGF